MSKFKFLIPVCFVFSFSLSALAQQGSRMTYDLSGGLGSYDGETYSEVRLGLNYYIQEWLNWRNSLFTQFGSQINTVYGLDSAAIFRTDLSNESRTLGVSMFAGPGVRLATEDSTAVFGTAGLTLALGGLRIGGGATFLSYFEERTDKSDRKLPKDEVQYFITLSGGGGF